MRMSCYATLFEMAVLPLPDSRFATARVHRLKLVTSDQRIVESGLVPVVE
jgi:hypothetical protein